MDQISYNDYGQATQMRIGGGSCDDNEKGANPLTEQYSSDDGIDDKSEGLARQYGSDGSDV